MGKDDKIKISFINPNDKESIEKVLQSILISKIASISNQKTDVLFLSDV